ncbi:hypothetical protein FFI97_025105 [Variovorax sp. KBS0712]|nr:hypothetical protein FFI97_025105 [Variovorax sp. KBS0712]
MGEIVRINQRTVTVHCNGRAWRVTLALPQHVTDVTPRTTLLSSPASRGLFRRSERHPCSWRAAARRGACGLRQLGLSEHAQASEAVDCASLRRKRFPLRFLNLQP